MASSSPRSYGYQSQSIVVRSSSSIVEQTLVRHRRLYVLTRKKMKVSVDGRLCLLIDHARREKNIEGSDAEALRDLQESSWLSEEATAFSVSSDVSDCVEASTVDDWYCCSKEKKSSID